ncbi:hypothetical protein H4R20_002001 [Coemansia guatemalensis]|uniref:Uncharacterized protein n=1 Tax=Coemansia guatemalensis TaxID=2761395 RepID=A0A9W8I4P8_9FUNG|nr:hypothetical protein H4R20_002001 [Coemansia guatemalensis]
MSNTTESSDLPKVIKLDILVEDETLVIPIGEVEEHWGDEAMRMHIYAELSVFGSISINSLSCQTMICARSDDDDTKVYMQHYTAEVSATNYRKATVEDADED